MAEFSLSLNDDQKQIRDWVHDFAATVVRPAASEWTSARSPVADRARGRQDRSLLVDFSPKRR